MTDSIGMALLAAGKGTRLKIDTPKPLLPLLGRAMVDYVLDSATDFAKNVSVSLDIGVVVGHAKEQVINHLKQIPNIHFAEQLQQNGTADAMRAYFSEIKSAATHDYTLVACADTPLLTPASLEKLYSMLKNKKLKAIAASFKLDNPTGYGRIKRAKQGFTIIEQKDASDTEKLITEVNSGLYIVETQYLIEMLNKVDNKNKSGEFYLTDIFQENQEVEALEFSCSKEFLGVNTLIDWEFVKSELHQTKNQSLMLKGVMFEHSQTTFIDWPVAIGAGTVLGAGVHIIGKTIIGKNSKIGAYSIIENSQIDEEVEILSHTHIAESILRKGCSVGPFARVRPGSDFASGVKVGNFVETKKSILHSGVKVSHLSYVGDAEIGDETNIGCGFITCNYDGANKFKTSIGKNCFIGSDVQMIAPIQIGDNCFIAAGSTITQSIENGAFAVARGRQETKPNLAKKFIKKK